MSIPFESRNVNGVPLLLARPAHADGPLPAVLWFHGFSVDKDTHRKELEQLARAGFLAVGVDAAGHGERRTPQSDARITAPGDSLHVMIDYAAQTADEVPGVIRALADEGVADPARVAVVGISMGGYVVYRAVLAEPAPRAAVAILGSPRWPGGNSPHRHLDAFRRTALLSITAENDENVPPAAARALHRRLAEIDPDAPRHRYVELPGAVHLMSPEHWETTMDETLRWLRHHLG